MAHEIIRDLGGDDAHEELTATGAVRCAEIMFTGDGLAAVNIGSRNYVSGERVPVCTNCLVSMDAASATLFRAGQTVAMDTTTKLAVVDGAAGSVRVGRCVVAKTNGQTSVLVRLNGQRNAFESAAQSIRVRATVAQINAGLVVLPALAGYAYRIHDAAMIAVGGAVTGATTVDVLATQAAASVKVLAVAVAALTQSALVRAGAANATILADGASFAPCDVNTAVSINKTGANAATATNVDLLLTFSVESA
jgi:hypothetical protein